MRCHSMARDDLGSGRGRDVERIHQVTKRMVELRPPNGGRGAVVIGYVGPLDGWLALVELLRSEGYVSNEEHVAGERDVKPDTVGRPT